MEKWLGSRQKDYTAVAQLSCYMNNKGDIVVDSKNTLVVKYTYYEECRLIKERADELKKVIIYVCFIMLLMCSCSSPKDTNTSKKSKSLISSINADIQSNYRFAEDPNYNVESLQNRYYFARGNSVFRFSRDTEKLELVCTCDFSNRTTSNYNFYIHQDNIYYLKRNEANNSGEIYEMKLNGTGKREISDDFGVNLQVHNDYLYYVVYMTGTLKRIDLTSDNREKQIVDEKDHSYEISKYYFYKNNIMLETSGALYTIDFDGENRTLLCDKAEFFDSTILNNLIINCTIRETDDNKSGLSTFNLESNEFIVLDEQTPKDIDDNDIFYARSTGMVVGEDEKIYYTLTNGTYRINLDGSGKTLLTNKSLPYMCFVNKGKIFSYIPTVSDFEVELDNDKYKLVSYDIQTKKEVEYKFPK